MWNLKEVRETELSQKLLVLSQIVQIWILDKIEPNEIIKINITNITLIFNNILISVFFYYILFIFLKVCMHMYTIRNSILL